MKKLEYNNLFFDSAFSEARMKPYFNKYPGNEKKNLYKYVTTAGNHIKRRGEAVTIDKIPRWKVYISNKLTEPEYAEGKVNELLANNNNVTFTDSLHLGVSLRSFRAEKLSAFVHSLLVASRRMPQDSLSSTTVHTNI